MVNPLDFNQNHVGSVSLDYELSSDNMFLNGLDANLLFHSPVGMHIPMFSDQSVDRSMLMMLV